MYPNLIKFPTLDHFGVTRFLDNSILWSGLWNRQVAMGWRPHTRSWSCRPPHPPTELATSHLYNARKACAILVGGWPTPLKNDGVKVPTEWKNKKCSKAPTRIEMRVLPGAHQRHQHIGTTWNPTDEEKGQHLPRILIIGDPSLSQRSPPPQSPQYMGTVCSDNLL